MLRRQRQRERRAPGLPRQSLGCGRGGSLGGRPTLAGAGAGVCGMIPEAEPAHVDEARRAPAPLERVVVPVANGPAVRSVRRSLSPALAFRSSAALQLGLPLEAALAAALVRGAGPVVGMRPVAAAREGRSAAERRGDGDRRCEEPLLDRGVPESFLERTRQALGLVHLPSCGFAHLHVVGENVGEADRSHHRA